MSKLTTRFMNNCFEDYEKSGRELYKNNKNYRTIANCMEYPEFRKMFDDNDPQIILLFLKLYQKIDEISTVELSSYQKLALLDSIMKDKHMRREICNGVNNRNKDLLSLNI